jgi:hypothetical protein
MWVPVPVPPASVARHVRRHDSLVMSKCTNSRGAARHLPERVVRASCVPSARPAPKWWSLRRFSAPRCRHSCAMQPISAPFSSSTAWCVSIAWRVPVGGQPDFRRRSAVVFDCGRPPVLTSFRPGFLRCPRLVPRPKTWGTWRRTRSWNRPLPTRLQGANSSAGWANQLLLSVCTAGLWGGSDSLCPVCSQVVRFGQAVLDSLGDFGVGQDRRSGF